MNKKCQIFTPDGYVKKLLDCIQYCENIYDKNILENSCGDGNILAVIAERYIDDAKAHGLSNQQIKKGLSKHICGVEIDPEQYKKCLQKLNSLAKKRGINGVRWNIVNEDYLKWECDRKFEFIVGNPPYITYQELDEENRDYVRKKFSTCEKGKFDYCYAFIERSVDSLSDDGKMSYLIPSSIFKTVFGKKLRSYIKPYLQEIYDYTQDKMFDDMGNLILSCHDCNHNKNSFWIEKEEMDTLNPDGEKIKNVFIRDDKYYIRINDEFKENTTIEGFYNKLCLGSELHRLDYLIMNIIGLQRSCEDNSDLYVGLGKILDTIREKRNIM